MVDKLIKGIIDNTSLTEDETIEVISILRRKGINLVGMEINQAINYVVDKTKILWYLVVGPRGHKKTNPVRG